MFTIKVLIPNSGMDRETLAAREDMLSRAVSKETRILAACIPCGPDSIESNTDEVLAGPELLRMAIQAEAEGCDAVIIYCFSDLAIDAVRENVRIPVIGPGEETIGLAGRLTNRYSVITTTGANVPRTYRRLMKDPAVRGKMAEVVPLDIPVIALREDRDATKNYLDHCVKMQIEKHHVDGIVLGCLGMADYGDEIEQRYGIRVFDPSRIAVSQAECYVRNGQSHGIASYPPYRKGQQYGLY